MKITENHLERLKDAIAFAQSCGDKELVAYLRFDSREQALKELREIDKNLKAWQSVKTSWRGKFWEEGDWFEVVVAWEKKHE